MSRYLTLVMISSLFIIISCTSAYDKWEEVKVVDTVNAHEKFLADHHDSEYARLARRRIAQLQAKAAWDGHLPKNNVDSLKAFKKNYWNSDYADSAGHRITELGARRDWVEALETPDLQRFEEFVASHPTSEYRDRATAVIDSIRFANADAKCTIYGYEEYLDSMPDGAYREKCREYIDALYYEHVPAPKMKMFEVKYRPSHRSQCDDPLPNTYCPDLIERYLSRYPEGKHAKYFLDLLELYCYYEAAGSADIDGHYRLGLLTTQSLTYYTKIYLERFPRGIYADKVNKIEMLSHKLEQTGWLELMDQHPDLFENATAIRFLFSHIMYVYFGNLEGADYYTNGLVVFEQWDWVQTINQTAYYKVWRYRFRLQNMSDNVTVVRDKGEYIITISTDSGKKLINTVRITDDDEYPETASKINITIVDKKAAYKFADGFSRLIKLQKKMDKDWELKHPSEVSLGVLDARDEKVHRIGYLVPFSGVAVEYWESGPLKRKIIFKDGIIEKVETFHINGAPWIEWNITQTRSFRNEWSYYGEPVYAITPMENGKREEKYLWTNGIIRTRKELLDNGNIADTQCWHVNGKPNASCRNPITHEH